MAKPSLIAAIDVGSSKIATLIAQVNQEENKIHIVGASSSDSKGIRKGQIVNIEEAAQSIINSVEGAERMAGYNLAKSYVSIGGSHIASQNSTGVVAVAQPQGEITQQDVSRVVEAARAVSLPEAREIVHVIPREFSVDSQKGIKDPIGMTGVRLEVETHIITGSSTAIKNLAKCVGEVGCDIESIVFSGLAASYAVLSETERELGVILIDIGAGTTDIAIFVEGSLAYSSVLPIGAKNVTNDLAIGLRVSLESAEKIKIFLGQESKKPALPEKMEQGREKEEEKEKKDELDLGKLNLPEDLRVASKKTLIDGIIKPRLNEIFQLVAQEIKKSGFAGLAPSGLVITGGGALTVGAVEAGKRILAMPVRVGMPSGVTGLIDDIETPAFASSLGLILYGARKDFVDEDHNLGGKGFGKALDKLPGKGIAGKLTGFIKSLLP